jgi:hypothetical protein
MFFGEYYYLILALQGFCVFHSIRNGTQSKWLWIIVIIPLIGALIYVYSEILSKKDLSKVQVNLGGVLNPGGRIKELERKLEFSQTFDNQVSLADACMAGGQIDRAIVLYETSLTGVFQDSVYVLSRLLVAYFEKEQYEDVLKTAARVKNHPDFRKTHAHVCYALTLEQTGDLAAAEKEFQAMQGRFADFEARVCYAEFLIRSKRLEEAKAVLTEIAKEGEQMTRAEKRTDQAWFNKAIALLNDLP